MKPFSLAKIAEATGGLFVGEETLLNQLITGVTIDSRNVKPGDLFVPIRGERFDGHQFIQSAMAEGAICTLSEHPVKDIPYIQVDDTLKAFQALAEFYKSRFSLKTIGITGSVGKTTTKEMIASVLEQSFSVLKSHGNLNNQTGVPLTLFRLEDHHQIAIVEMGTNHFGEIRNLAKTARPDLCFLTNIGDAHVEHLGSREGILKAKCEMLEFLPPDGQVFINGDDTLLQTIREKYEVVSFGLAPGNDIRAYHLTDLGLEGTSFSVFISGKEERFHISAPGKHMIYNALAAIAAGLAFSMDIASIRKGIISYTPIAGRMCIEKCGGITVLNDVYNANPTSMKAAIDVLATANNRKVCILGDMLELGGNEAEFHRQIGKYAVQKHIDLILCVGTLAKSIYDGAIYEGGNAFYYNNQKELISRLPKHIQTGDSVLIKASRGMKLEKIVEALMLMPIQKQI